MILDWLNESSVLSAFVSQFEEEIKFIQNRSSATLNIVLTLLPRSLVYDEWSSPERYIKAIRLIGVDFIAVDENLFNRFKLNLFDDDLRLLKIASLASNVHKK